MNWISFALLSALFISIASIIEKRTLFYEHAMEYSAVLATVVAIISLPFFFLVDYSAVNAKTIFLMLTTATVGGVATFFIARSSRHLEISTSSPLLVLGPAITSALAYFVLGERISLLQSLGMLVLIVGAYLLEMREDSKISDPIRIFLESRFVHMLLLGLFIGSISSLIDRTILHNNGVSVFTYLAFVNFFQGIVYIIMLSIYHDGFAGIKHGFQTAGLSVFFIAALVVASRFFQAAAVQLVYVGIVLAVKRTSSIFTALIGGEIFHEENIARKVFACLVMVLGTILIIIHF